MGGWRRGRGLTGTARSGTISPNRLVGKGIHWQTARHKRIRRYSITWSPRLAPRNSLLPVQSKRVGITRFAAAERGSATVADFNLNPTDILKRRTVYLGMSRSGKSNGLKVVAESIYRLREMDAAYRIGQLIFDPSGEYAQDNPQDGKALHKIHEAVGLDRAGEIETYGLLPVPWDGDRKMMKINFFGDPIPKNWKTTEVETSLVQLIAGREIINSIMAGETARYTTAFRNVDLAVPSNVEGDVGSQIRY